MKAFVLSEITKRENHIQTKRFSTCQIEIYKYNGFDFVIQTTVKKTVMYKCNSASFGAKEYLHNLRSNYIKTVLAIVYITYK